MKTSPNVGLNLPEGSDVFNHDTFLKQNFEKIDSSLTQSTQRTKNIWLDVQQDFGAKGDGITDDTASLQSAYDYAKDKGSVRLYFPEGVYCVNNYIRIYKNTTVELHPNAIIKRIGTTNKVFVNGQPDNALYATGHSGDGNIYFDGGTIDLNQSTLAPNVTLSCFDLGHGKDIFFTKLKIKNGQIGHYFQLSSCKNVRFKDCWFGDVVYSDMTAATYEVIQIEEATSTSFPTFGAYDQTLSRDIYIEDCTFENVIRAIGTHSIGYNVFGENINIINCTINNAYDNALSLWQYKNVTVKNTLINGCKYGIHMHTLQDSNLSGNVILNAQKSGFWLSTCSGNKFSKNILKEIGLSADGSNLYYGIQMQGCTNNTFDDDTITSLVPKYTSAWYASAGSTGNKILSHNYTKGLVSTISGENDTEIANIQMGNGQTVLFDGDLSTNGSTATLSHDIRNFNFLVIMGNDNGSATAQIISMLLPKSAIILGTTSRFRLICDDSSAADRIDFSFPTATSIQADAINGTCHIRKVIGIV